MVWAYRMSVILWDWELLCCKGARVKDRFKDWPFAKQLVERFNEKTSLVWCSGNKFRYNRAHFLSIKEHYESIFSGYLKWPWEFISWRTNPTRDYKRKNLFQAGVKFKATNEQIYRCCLWSRLASRFVRVLSELIFVWDDGFTHRDHCG